MGTVNYTNREVDLTVRVFDSFYNFELDVPAQEYDAVNSYFRSIFKTKEAAENFTVTLFRVAQSNQVPVLSVLQQLQSTTGNELTALLAYYLNAERSGSTLLGVAEAVQPNFYAARNVRA